MGLLGIEHRAPPLARVVSVITGFLAVQSLLRAGMQFASAPDSHGRVIAHPIITIVQSLLLLVGSIQLWNMQRLAALCFGAELCIAIYSAVYFTFVAPSSQMLQYKGRTNVSVIVFGGLTIELLRCLYVWWVTSTKGRAKTREIFQS
jgi:hypothetical protein